jgi:hypothetical protein
MISASLEQLYKAVDRLSLVRRSQDNQNQHYNSNDPAQQHNRASAAH